MTTAMAELRTATWPSHQRLEKRLDVKRRFSETGAYRAHLQKMWGFHAGVEASLAAAHFGTALVDFDVRRKLPLLTRDLLALGMDPADVGALPRCTAVPDLADAAAAFGSAYVLEGATLGGRTLLPLVHARLGLTGEHGAAYLAGYHGDTARMWERFCASLNGWCDDAQRRRSASRVAVATFDALGHWLCGEPA